MLSGAALSSGVAIAALLLGGCGESEKSSRGLDFMPEMYNHPGYESQGVRERGEGTTRRHVPTMLLPVEGTVSRDGAAYTIPAAEFALARNLVNPVVPTAAVLRRGQRMFNATCAVCHGRDGDAAHGYVAPTKEHPDRFGGIPSVNTQNVALMTDGEIYHIISRGRNRMADLSAQLLPADRWAVTHYTRALARATQAIGDAEVRLAKLEKEAQQAITGNNPYDKAELDAVRALVAQRKQDLLLIQQGGEGDEFVPSPRPAPEYIKPTWDAEK
jgi:mono/diheme cytochrome c family protein